MPSPGNDNLTPPSSVSPPPKAQAPAIPLEPVLSSARPADPPLELPVSPELGSKPAPRAVEGGTGLPAETSAEQERLIPVPFQFDGLSDSATETAANTEDFGFSPVLDNLIWETGQRRQAEAVHPVHSRSTGIGVRFTGEVNRRLAQMEAFHNGQPMARVPQPRSASMGGQAPVFGPGSAAPTAGPQATVERLREWLSAAVFQSKESASDQAAPSTKTSPSAAAMSGGGQSEAIPMATAPVATATDPIRPAVPQSQTSQEAVGAPEEASFGQTGPGPEQHSTGGGKHREPASHQMAPASLVNGAVGNAEHSRGVSFPRVGVPLSSQQLDQLADQVAGKLARVATNGTVVVPLDPPELGRVLARFVRRGEELKVQLVAESAEAASALTKEIGRLQSALGKPGEQVRVEVQVAGEGFQRSGQGQAHGQAQAREEAPLPRWVYGSGNARRAEAPVLPVKQGFGPSRNSGLNILT